MLIKNLTELYITYPVYLTDIWVSTYVFWALFLDTRDIEVNESGESFVLPGDIIIYHIYDFK